MRHSVPALLSIISGAVFSCSPNLAAGAVVDVYAPEGFRIPFTYEMPSPVIGKCVENGGSGVRQVTNREDLGVGAVYSFHCTIEDVVTRQELKKNGLLQRNSVPFFALFEPFDHKGPFADFDQRVGLRHSVYPRHKTDEDGRYLSTGYEVSLSCFTTSPRCGDLAIDEAIAALERHFAVNLAEGYVRIGYAQRH